VTSSLMTCTSRDLSPLPDLTNTYPFPPLHVKSFLLRCSISYTLRPVAWNSSNMSLTQLSGISSFTDVHSSSVRNLFSSVFFFDTFSYAKWDLLNTLGLGFQLLDKSESDPELLHSIGCCTAEKYDDNALFMLC